MATLAEFDFVPGGFVTCLVVGLVAGLLAGFMRRDNGQGVLADVGAGLLGAAVTGLLFGLFVSGTTGSFGTILAAFLGAWVLIVIFRIRSWCRSDH